MNLLPKPCKLSFVELSHNCELPADFAADSELRGVLLFDSELNSRIGFNRIPCLVCEPLLPSYSLVYVVDEGQVSEVFFVYHCIEQSVHQQVWSQDSSNTDMRARSVNHNSCQKLPWRWLEDGQFEVDFRDYVRRLIEHVSDRVGHLHLAGLQRTGSNLRIPSL